MGVCSGPSISGKVVAEFVVRSVALCLDSVCGYPILPLHTFGHATVSFRKLPKIDTIDGIGGQCATSGRVQERTIM